MDKQMWLVYAALAGICWGTYVPFVQQGIQGLGRNALASFLCVGVAYFLIAVLYPVGMFVGGEKTPEWNIYGISMATLAGVAGALGALCVILANGAAVDARARPGRQLSPLHYAGHLRVSSGPQCRGQHRLASLARERPVSFRPRTRSQLEALGRHRHDRRRCRARPLFQRGIRACASARPAAVASQPDTHIKPVT